MPSAELQSEVAEPLACSARPRVREQLLAAVLREREHEHEHEHEHDCEHEHEREREVQDPKLSACAAIRLVSAAR